MGIQPGQLGNTADAVETCFVYIAVDFIKGQKGDFFFAARRHGDDLFAIDFH